MISKIVETNKGLIEGIEEERGYRFLGVPFVKAPIGDLSFKRPQEVEKWSGIYKADKPKANPIQREGTFSVGYNNQDSLYLNIYVPKIAKEKEKIPVMVWIYGGSYATGGTGLKNDKTLQIEYDSSNFANDTGCIIVNFNYRLNIYGYLNLHSISDDFDLNNGIYDQMAALKFIKENIASFGGDENNITLFGQSAGGSSIIALMSIPEISNLFHKAIVMSPVSEHFFFPKESRKLAKKYLSYLKINKKNLDKLYSLTPQEIKGANKKLADYAYRKGELRCPFSPTIDGVLLKDEPKKLAALNNKPLLIGNVVNEGNLFLLKAPDFALPFMVKLFGLKLKKKKGDTYRHRASVALTHKLYIDPMLEILSNYQGKAYKYEYQYTSPDCAKLGVETFHACDVPVLFGYNTPFERVDDPKTQSITKTMRMLFSKFAHNEFNEYEEYKINKKEIIIK